MTLSFEHFNFYFKCFKAFNQTINYPTKVFLAIKKKYIKPVKQDNVIDLIIDQPILTSPACFAIVFTCSGSFEPNTEENTAARTLCSKAKK